MMLSKEGMLLFAAENRVRYLKPIKPLERYVILTTCTIRRDVIEVVVVVEEE